MKWKVAAVLTLLAVGLGTAGYVILAPGANSGTRSQFLTATVARQDVVQQVVATGNAQAAVVFNLAFGTDPVVSTGSATTGAGGAGGTWLVKTVAVAVGDRVAAGDVLASADTSVAAAAVELAKANLAVAKARLAVDQAGPTAADRASAYDSIRQAQRQLSVARQGQTQTASQNDLSLSQAQDALATAQAQLAADQAAGPPSATITADQAAVTQAQQQLDTLQLQIQASATQASLSDQQNALKLSQAQATLAAAQQKLTQDLAAASPPPDLISSDQRAVVDAQAQVDALNLQVQGAGSLNSVTYQQNNLKLSQAQAALTAAQSKLAADQAAGPLVTTIAADQAAIKQAQQRLDSLKLNIESSATQAANQLASAQLGLTAARNTYATRIIPATAATIATDKAAVTGAANAVSQAQRALDQATLTSPVDGIVTAVNLVAGAIAPDSAAVVVASNQMEIAGTVTETDLPSLAVGQAVSVQITATGAAATGTVKEIIPTGTLTNGVVRYPIIVALDQAPTGTASGMSADIRVVTAQATGVLAVPARAVSGSGGNYAVRVLGADGTVTTQAVQVGLATNSLVEITAGLTEGQVIVTGINTAQTGTTTTSGNQFQGGGLDVFEGPGGGGGGAGHAGGGTGN